MSSGSSSSASATSCSKSVSDSKLIAPILGRGRHCSEHAALPERILQRCCHRGVVRRLVRRAHLFPGLCLRLLEWSELAGLELDARVREEAIGDSREVCRPARISFEETGP